MPTDQEIARNVKLTNISKLLDQLGIEEDDFEFYGKYTGKIKLNVSEKLWKAVSKNVFISFIPFPGNKTEYNE